MDWINSILDDDKSSARESSSMEETQPPKFVTPLNTDIPYTLYDRDVRPWSESSWTKTASKRASVWEESYHVNVDKSN